MSEIQPVVVQILEKEYRVACPPEERDALLAAARFLNERMLEVRDGGRVVGIDRIAVIAALNITHEFLQLTTDKAHHVPEGGSGVSARIRALQERIEQALHEGRQMEL
jgi:cell division protein ZapA